MTAALTAGARFGRYTLVRQLAIGGMAEIYLARIEGIGAFAKQVVLKRILAQYASSSDFVEMFLHEARLAAGLQHPNIVQVFDIGEIDGNYFFTMEYVQGYDLRAVLKATRARAEQLPLAQAIAYVSEAAAGLHHAHEQLDDQGRPLGIVHRDVSPSNIMVSIDGAVKVADFGIAKAASQTIETRTGTLKGKISYMSPEQCRGDDLDRRSDVFALGIVLHELITGRRVFHAENDYAILRKIVEQDAPTLASVGPGEYPAELERILAKALARDRDQRYATAQALQLDLENLARDLKLDGSSIARASYIKQLLGTPPAGVTIASPTPKPPEDDDASSVPTTQRGRDRVDATESTAYETPASVGTAGKRTRRRLALIAGVAVALGGGVTWLANRTPGHSAAAPADAAEPAVVTTAPTPDAARLVDAGTADGPTADAPTDAAIDAGRPRRPKVDPCRAWKLNQMGPPPEGCDLPL